MGDLQGEVGVLLDEQTAMLQRALRSAMILNSSLVISGANPRLGSSHSSSFGRLIRARATASICCSPPDRLPARWPRRSDSRGNVSYHRSMSRPTSPSLRV